MFVQVVCGEVGDAAALRRRAEEMGSSVAGFLGAAGGAAADGRAVVVVRLADAPSGPPVPERWFDGPVEAWASSDVEVLGAGVAAAAGYLEVIRGRTADRATFMALERRIEEGFTTERPDFLGSLLLWWPGGEWLEVASFTSEAETRAADAAPLPPALAALVEEWEAVAGPSPALALPAPWTIGL